MRDDDDGYQSFRETLLIAVLPVAAAALIEHVVAPLVGHVVQQSAAPKPRSRKRSKAAARGFAAFVAHERGGR